MADACARRPLRRAAWLFLFALNGCAVVQRERAVDEVVVDGERYRLERIARSDPGVVDVAPGWIRHPQRGVLAVHAQTPTHWEVRIAVPPPSEAAPAPTATDALPPAPVLAAAGHFVELDGGLPRAAQWRRCLDVRIEDGALVLVAPPARKGLAGVRRWRREGDQWRGEALPLSGVAFDYGCIARGDFNADGRGDVALAMHLQRFSAWMGEPDGRYVSANDGLPVLRAIGTANGSGIALATLTAGDGDRLLALNEVSGVPMAQPAPGLAEYRWTGQHWIATPIAEPLRGGGLALSQLPGCDPLLAVESSRNGDFPIFRRDRGQWQRADAPALPDEPALWFGTAVAAGDFDGHGCADLALARRSRHGNGWANELLAWTNDGDGWRALPRIHAASAAQITVVHAAALGPGRIELLTGNADGDVDRYLVEDGALRWAGHLAGAGWRQGCGVSAIAASGAGRWIVAMAGESDLMRSTRCPSGGGLVEIEWRDGGP